MARFDNAGAWGRPAGSYGAASAAEYDTGLRKHLLSVYNYMASGLVLTGIVALVVANSPGLMQAIYGTGLKYVVMLLPPMRLSGALSAESCADVAKATP